VAEFFDTLELYEERDQIAEKLLLEIRRRIKFMIDVGLEYCRSTVLLRRFPAARRSVFNGRLISVPCSSAHCMFWTNLQSGLHPARQYAPRQNSRKFARHRQHGSLVVEHDERNDAFRRSHIGHRTFMPRTREISFLKAIFVELLQDENSPDAK
jgi:hypothetical protein